MKKRFWIARIREVGLAGGSQRRCSVLLELLKSNPKIAPKAALGDAALLTVELSRMKGKWKEL